MASNHRIFLSVFIALILTPHETVAESFKDEKNEELNIKDEIIAEKQNIITSLQRELALLKVVQDAWLPPWLAARLSYATRHWKEHGKPSFEYFMRKVLEEKAEAEKWIEPHLQAIKTKCVSTARELWFLVRTNVDVKSLSKRAKEVYIQSRDALTPRMTYIKEVLVSYFQVSEKKAQAEKWIEPHVQTIKTKCASAAREQWLSVRTNVDAKSLSEKAKEVYIQFKDALISHMRTIKEVADSLVRAVKKASDTYIATKSHFDKSWETVAPYRKQTVTTYGKFLELLKSIIIRFMA